MIALLTMTGARPDQFALCAQWMKNQDYQGEVTWVIVDDGDPMTSNVNEKNFKDKWTIKKIYPTPKWKQGENTQARNIREGLKVIKKLKPEIIFIIEDDDYYRPCYLSEMVKRMGTYDLIGESHTVYYNAVSRRYHVNENKEWSSLFQTAFKPSLIPKFDLCYGRKFIDHHLFNITENKLTFRAGNLGVGMKGMPGRGGIGAGHDILSLTPDLDMSVLKAFIGSDSVYYERFYNPEEVAKQEKIHAKKLEKVSRTKHVNRVMHSHRRMKNRSRKDSLILRKK